MKDVSKKEKKTLSTKKRGKKTHTLLVINGIFFREYFFERGSKCSKLSETDPGRLLKPSTIRRQPIFQGSTKSCLFFCKKGPKRSEDLYTRAHAAGVMV